MMLGGNLLPLRRKPMGNEATYSLHSNGRNPCNIEANNNKPNDNV